MIDLYLVRQIHKDLEGYTSIGTDLKVFFEQNSAEKIKCKEDIFNF